MSTADRPESWPVTRHEVLATGRVSDFVQDRITTPDGGSILRQYVTHPGAVAIIAWDEQDRIACVQQYRHPVQMALVEPPAGLLDGDHEVWLDAAVRELAEEALLAADQWRVLVDVFTTPGGCQESIRVYLATALRPAPRPDGFVVEGEEAHMDLGWVPRADLVEGILAGRLQSPSLVSGVLALETARLSGRLDRLRTPDAPWPARQVKEAQDRRLG